MGQTTEEADLEYEGQVNYEAWRDHQGGKRPDGALIPLWAMLSPEEKHAWMAGAQAVAMLLDDTRDVE